jgi:hypothetical protein
VSCVRCTLGYDTVYQSTKNGKMREIQRAEKPLAGSAASGLQLPVAVHEHETQSLPRAESARLSADGQSSHRLPALFNHSSRP